MGLRINFQKTGLIPNDGEPILISQTSVNIGRGEENDVVLPDPDRAVSKNHCSLEIRADECIIIDMSTNGTFLNYGKIPIGKNPTKISDGDILSVGPYELSIDIGEFSEQEFDSSYLQNFAGEEPNSLGGPELDQLIQGDQSSGSSNDFLDDLMTNDDTKNNNLGSSDLLNNETDIFAELGVANKDILSNDMIPDDIDFETTVSDHSPSSTDGFNPSSFSGNVIPDDWDDEVSDPLVASLSEESSGTNNLAGQGEFEKWSPDVEVNKKDIPEAISIDLEEAKIITDVVDGTVSSESIDDILFGADNKNNVSIVKENTKGFVDNSVMDSDLEEQAVKAELVIETVSLDISDSVKPSDTIKAHNAFFDALGVDDLVIPETELEGTMARMGLMCKSLISGIREILMTRTSIKNEFKMNQTMISASGNNPLKFSVSANEAIKSLVNPPAAGYLSSEVAVEEALRDVKAHEIAMVTGMEEALKSVLMRLSPEQLELRMEKTGSVGSLLKGKKARYWEIYEKMYSEISDQAENEFQELFSKEFSNAYEAQLKKLK